MSGFRTDARTLAARLARTVRGEVRFDNGSRALYATDASNYRQVPIGVVLPRDADDIVATLEACRRHGAPVLARGGGTSLAGQGCNTAIVIDTSKYLNRILEIDPSRSLARVEPGVVLDDLRAAAENHGLTFGPDPATHDRCTLGGMIGNNACGLHSIMAGRTSDNVEELEVLTYEGLRMRVGRTGETELASIIRHGGRRGEIYAGMAALRDRYGDLIRERYPKIPRRVSGYNLDELLPEQGFHVARALVGTESTCAVVLEATLRLVPSPPARVLLVLGYPDVFSAGDHVPDVAAHRPIALEGMDDRLVDRMRKQGLYPSEVRTLPDGGGWLLVELGGETVEEARAAAHELTKALRTRGEPPSVRLFDDPAAIRRVWEMRESSLGAAVGVAGEPNTWPGWEDAAVPPERVGAYLRDFRGLVERYGYTAHLYGHFGDGCIHCRIDFDLVTAAGIAAWRSFLEEAADLVVGYGGSLSGEHGDGHARAELLPRMFGPELVEAFRTFKSLWDPAGRMNPGKIVTPYGLDESLRPGAQRSLALSTRFSYPQDGGSFAAATLRCVGAGTCRKTGSGTMCPSYMATREERHSTRGRARMLFEMLVGDPLRGGWRDRDVKESLELCLSCKACKSECPARVDMATYKAEFAAHHYRGRLRPVQAYSMGLIYWWARLAAHAPGLVNLVLGARRLSRVVKRLGGVAPERPAPRFATRSFRAWFEARESASAGAPPVVLWTDTFTNFFQPWVAVAAVEVLEEAGYQVQIPARVLCCGRPLFDYGMLSVAGRLLRQVLEVMQPHIEAGTPIVGLEPSCVAVFRDELANLIPGDPAAMRLARQVRTLGELLDGEGYRPPPLALPAAALVHLHCHQKAVLGFEADQRLLDALGLDYRILDSGCCGLAGSFGFERGEKHRVSVAVGERILLPAVRAAPEEALILTDGFSCRTQIEHLAGRRALHLAEVLRMAQEPVGD